MPSSKTKTRKSNLSLLVGVLFLGASLFSAFMANAEEPEQKIKSALDEVFGTSTLVSDKKERCEAAVVKARESASETRTPEELLQVCLAMPSDHDTDCGFPLTSEEYFVVENQHCVAKLAGRPLLHAQARKVEARERSDSFYNEIRNGGSDNGGTATGTSAQ